jgi:hypothetical protein
MQPSGFVGSGEPDDFPQVNHLNEFAMQIRQLHRRGCGGAQPPQKDLAPSKGERLMMKI